MLSFGVNKAWFLVSVTRTAAGTQSVFRFRDAQKHRVYYMLKFAETTKCIR